MRIEDREDFVDLVAQAVIDRIEERDRIDGLVNMVVAKVIEMQRQEAAAQAASANGASHNGDSPDHDNVTPVAMKEATNVETIHGLIETRSSVKPCRA